MKDEKISFLRDLLSGPIVFAIVAIALKDSFGYHGAFAMALAGWMAAWWILRPVSVSVTALLPIAVNAAFDIIPNSDVISKYFAEIVVLLLGADMISMTWTTSGLDRRISVKTLCSIGTSMKEQIFVWLTASVVLSIFLPNVVVAAIFCPIACAMLKFVGEKDITKSPLAVPILLAIGWGSGIGGFGSPIGSGANLVAISYIEDLTGQEFMYFEWVIRFLPVLVIITALNVLFLWHLPIPAKELPGTKEFFQKMYAEFGPMKKSEKIGLWLFIIAMLLAFLRPLFADALPALRPAYCFFILGLVTFFVKDENGKPMLTWKYAESHAMWGMYFLFASGLALGSMIIKTGAVDKLAAIIASMNLDGGFLTLLIFSAFATAVSEMSSNTAAASIAIPVVISITQALGLNPVPYIITTIIAVSCAYVLPISTRAIPVSFDLDASLEIKRGIEITIINILLTSCVGYLGMKFLTIYSTF